MRRVPGGARSARRAAVVAVLGLAALAPVLVGATGGAVTRLDPGTGLSTNYDFAQLVLRDGGWPVSASNVTVLTQWLRAEEPATHWWDRDNPLNNGFGSGGGSGLGSYGSVVTAAYDVARNLENPAYGYPLIVRDLAHAEPAAVTAWAIWRSSWASGHYGWGADWGTTPVPSVAAPPRAWRSPARCPVGYPVRAFGPCGHAFSATGPSWHAGTPGGLEGQEQWAFAGGGLAPDVATWQPRLAPGSYAVAAFIPAVFSDATVTYEVTDLSGTHPVRVNQEPYADAWAQLGVFEAGSGSIRVSLSASSAGPRDAYVAADALRFLPVAGHGRAQGGERRRQGVVRPPGRVLDVSAVAGAGSATVSWLPPSKDGGAAIQRFVATAVPGGRTCVAGPTTVGVASCQLVGLADGGSYRVVVRAQTRGGLGATSAPSGEVVPVGNPTLRVTVRAKALRIGARVVYGAVLAPAATGGTVLFAQDGRVLPGCQRARVVHGHAACAMRLQAAGRHQVLVTYSGSRALTGAQLELPVQVARTPTRLRAVATPGSVPQRSTVTLHAFSLPGLATGSVVFAAGPVRLCAARVRSGGATCTARLTLAVGVHIVRVRYSGSRDDLPSTARTSVRVLAPKPI